MFSADPRRLEWIFAIAAIAMCAVAAFIASAHSGAPEPARVLSLATPKATPTKPKRGLPARLTFDVAGIGAVTSRVPTLVHQGPDAASPVLSRLRPGVVLPVDAHQGPMFRVLTPCEATGWVRAADVLLHPKASGPPKSLSDAVIVLDPGHGGLQSGAIGPNGLQEKDANLAIARRLAEHLSGARVFLTRYFDFTAGLVYRARLANALGANALVSIHNNSAPDGPSDHPGSETWHQSRSPHAQKLAALMWGNLVDALRPFKVRWVADRKAGTRTRVNSHGHDYYGLLRGSTVPTVIVEAMFISNADEEALLRRPEGQDAVANGVARGLKRYVKDTGHDKPQPYAGAVGTTGGVPPNCVDPA